MKQGRLKSAFAFILAVAMAITTMFSPLTGLTAKAGNEIDVQLSLKEISTSNTWKLNWTLSDGEEFAEGFYRVQTTVDGVSRESLIEYDIYPNGSKNLLIYSHCFNSAALNASFCPKTSFSIAKDAVLIPAVQNQWTTEDTSRNRYKLTKAFGVKYNATTEAWEEEVAAKDVTLDLIEVDTNDNWKLSPTVADSSEMAIGWYRVETLVDGVTRNSLLEYYMSPKDGSKQIYIYSHCFNSGALNVNFRPQASFQISKDALLIPVVTNQWTTVDSTREAYRLTENFTVNYNTTTAAWEEAGSQQAAAVDVTLSLKEVNASNQWEFDYTLPTGQEFGSGFYRVPATVDGTARDVLAEYIVWGNGTKHLFIYAHTFNAPPSNGKNPKSSFSIAKDAIMTPVSTSDWTTEDTARSRYKLTEAFSATYNATASAWEEATQQVSGIDMTIALKTVNATSNNWEFDFTVVAGSELATGWYKVPATVDGESREVLMEYAVYGNGTKHLFIYGHCFNATPTNGKYPKTSLSIAKDAIMTPVSTSDWTTEDTARSRYKLTEAFSATYNTTTSEWEEATQQVSGIDMTIALKTVNATSNNWEFDFTVAAGSELATGWYKVPATVDGESREVLMEYAVYGNGTKHLLIYGHCFNATPTNGKYPKSSFSIKKDAILTPVVTSNWGTEDTARSKYKVTNDLSVTYNTTTSEWEEEGAPQVSAIDIALELMLVDAANNNWKFNFTVAAGSELATGWYKVPATVDGVSREVLMEYAVLGNGSKQLYIYGHCFNATPANGKYPKNSFSIAKDAIMTPVVVNNWGTEDTARSKYKLTDAFSATYNTEASAWEEAGSQIEVTTLNISSAASWSSDTVFPIKIGNQGEVAATRWHSEIDTASKPTWKRVQGTVNIDGEDTQITIDFPCNGEMFFNVSSDKEKMIIKADTLFQATNANFRVKFDKDYEVYISERLIYEEGQRPVEKNPISMYMTFNKVANGTFDFKYGSDVEGHPVAGQFYHVPAIIDGVEKEILVETGGTSGLVYIYEHCFASAPNKNSTPPTSSLKFEEGAIFYPVDKTTWTKNIGAQTYTLDKEVSIILVENAWMDEDYYNQIANVKPLEVEVKLDTAKGKVLRLKVATKSGKTIEEIYGDWTTAYGPIQRGVLNKEGGYDFTSVPSAIYSLTKEFFYFNTLSLGELDAVRIEAGTIIYPAEGCKSMQPMKIMNSFGIVRNAKDKWVLDEDFTTDYPGLNFKESTTATTNSSTNNKTSANATAGTTETTTTTTTNKDAKDTNKGVILKGDGEENHSTYVSLQGSHNSTWIASVIVITVGLCALCFIFLLLLKKRRKDKQEA